MNKLVFKVNETNCINFLKKYPVVMHLMVQAKGGKNLLSAYKNFLKLKDMNESKLGGRAECVGSVSFGTKTFYNTIGMLVLGGLRYSNLFTIKTLNNKI
jgi:hypothetical protein